MAKYIKATKRDVVNKLETVVIPFLTAENEDEEFSPRGSEGNSIFKSETIASRFIAVVKE